MNETATAPKPKKSVALSGVAAGNTALCTVGRTGNDLHYRGYDILDVAETCEFEEIAHLLVHGALPTAAELTAYKTKLKSLRGIPAAVKTVLEALPASTHPMDVMRTAVSALGCVLPERDDHNHPGARDIADRLMASLGSALLYWHHYAQNGRRIEVETDDDSIGGHFLHLLHGTAPSRSWVRAMHTSLILYAEHEFNASTFAAASSPAPARISIRRSPAASARCAGPSMAAPTRSRSKSRSATRHPTKPKPTSARASTPRKSIIGFGHPVYTIADPRNVVIKGVAQALSEEAGDTKMFDDRRTDRAGDGRGQEDVPEPRLVQRGVLSHDGRADRDVHAAVRDLAHRRLERACDRAAHRRQDHPADRQLHRPGKPAVRAACPAPPEGFSPVTYLVADDLPTEPAGVRFRALVERGGILQLPGTHNGQAA